MTTAIEGALWLAERGLLVAFAHAPKEGGLCTCGDAHEGTKSSVGKHPVGTAWQRRATTDVQKLTDWRHSLSFEPNVGVVLGSVPDGRYIVAIDVDLHTRLEELVAELGELPPTLTGASARGARLFFSVVGGVDSIKNIAGIGGKPGVDLKAKGGFCVVAPSLHASGVRYRWDSDAPIAELPAAWTQAITPLPSPPREHSSYDPTDRRARNRAEKWLRQVVNSEAAHVARAPDGMRNNVLYTAAMRVFPCVVGVNGSMAEARNELAAAARAADLPDPEIQKTLDSADKIVRDNGFSRTPPDRPKLRVVRPGDAGPAGDEPAEVELVLDDGKPAKIAENVARMLDGYPGGPPKLDEFADRVVWPSGRPLRDSDASIVQGWLLAQNPRVKASVDTVWSGLLLSAERNAFHPVRDWLLTLQWDRCGRIDTLFPFYFGSQDDDYTRAVGAGFLIAMVARIQMPGCQVDTMPVLEGNQGTRKSSALRAIAGQWFSDSPLDLDSKDAMSNLQGTWLQELAELEALTRGDMARLKGFLTSRVDRYRPAYGRTTIERPRQTCFAATTNATAYFSDETGGRRFRPIACGTIDVGALERDREQLFAEALTRFERGEQWWLSGAVEAHAADVVDERYQHDGWEDRIRALTIGSSEAYATTLLSNLGVEVGRQTRADYMRLSVIMRRLKWVKVRTLVGGDRVYRYVRLAK